MYKSSIGRQSHRTLMLFVLGGLLGAAAFLLIYGIVPLDVTSDAFCRSGYIEKDIQQHYAGWLFYRQSALGFPLCIAQNINFPAGLSVAYTDSIPLFAAIFRLLTPLLPSTFQYFGWFTFLCFILQGAFGALLLGLFTDNNILTLVGDVLFVSSPVLLERAIRHTSLGAQFFILAALYYYFKAKYEDKFTYPGLFLLNICCITIHPYFLPMVYALTLAMLLEYAFKHKDFFHPLAFLVSDLALTLVAGYCFGLFYGSSSGGSDALYGYFGLNLNSLWNPIGVNGTHWSAILPVQNQVAGNYDAFAYLGLGVLIGLVLSIVILLVQKKMHPVKIILSHWALVLVCAILTVFAISNVITANGATLLTIPLPDACIKLFSVFRSGGRMFWPAYYILILFAAVCWARIFPKSIEIYAMLALVVVQLWDISPGIIQRHIAMQSTAQQAAFPSALTSSFWTTAAGKYKQIASMDAIQADALHLALYAADHGLATNDPFAARYDEFALAKERTDLIEEISSGTLREDTLYLFAFERSFLQAVEHIGETDAWCGEIASGASKWYVIAPDMADYVADLSCTVFDESYPLRIEDYTDALWNRGVLSSTGKTVCFADSAFTRSYLSDAAEIICDGIHYPIINYDDNDAGWIMITLDIPDASVLCGKKLETK